MATKGVPLWSTTASSNSTADPAVNWAEGQAPSTVNNSARGMMASIADWRNDLYGITTGGTSTAYTVATGSTFASAADMSGAVFCIIPNATSGPAPTLAVDGLTARAINISTGAAVPTGALVSGTPYLVKYVHASTEFIVLGTLGKHLLASLDIINGTSETAIATDDTLPIYDLSNTANRRMLVSNFLKVVNALTEDTSPDSSADYVMTYDGSASGVKKVLLSNLPPSLPRGYIDGCIMSNNGSDATNDIDIAAGVCRDSTDTVDITIAASTKQLDANWAAGTTGGMRNSGAGIANATYHIYAVSKADGTSGIYAHTSTTVATVITALQAETGGADYLYARRIGSIVRSGATILGFVQFGNEFRYKSPILDVNAASQTTTSALRALTVPLGLKVQAIANVRALTASASSGSIYITSPDVTDEDPSLTAAPLASATVTATGVSGVGIGLKFKEYVNTSGEWRFDTVGTVTLYVATLGWEDSRGRDA